MKNFINIFTIIIGLSLFTACREDIDLVQDRTVTTVYYTTNDGKPVRLYNASNVISNTNIDGVGQLIINGSLKSFKDYFRNSYNLTSVVIPNGVTNIDSYAFYSCDELNSVELPKSLKSIGSDAFEYCYDLRIIYNFSSLSLSTGSTNYGYIAYYADEILRAPEGCELVEDFVFKHVDDEWYLQSYQGTVNNGYPDWASTNNSNSSTDEYTYTINASAGDVLTFDWWVDSESYDKLIVEIGYGQVLYQGGSYSGSYEHRFEYPGTYLMVVKYTKDGSYSYGSDMATVSNIKINGQSFGFELQFPYSCKGYDYIIGESAFENDNSLSTIRITSGVVAIGDKAFYNCNNLETVYCEGNTPATLGKSVFDSCDKLSVIYVPSTYIDEYKNKWSKYEHLIVAY